MPYDRLGLPETLDIGSLHVPPQKRVTHKDVTNEPRLKGNVLSLPDLFTAYERAREAAASAATVEHDTLMELVDEARRRNITVADIARAVGIPSTTLHNKIIRATETPSIPKTWATPPGYVRAYNHAWHKVPSRHINKAPFTMQIIAGEMRYKITPQHRNNT